MVKKWKKNHIVKITWLFHAVYSWTVDLAKYFVYLTFTLDYKVHAIIPIPLQEETEAPRNSDSLRPLPC